MDQFPIVSLKVFIDIILLAATWPIWLTQPLTEMVSRNMSWVKAAGVWG